MNIIAIYNSSKFIIHSNSKLVIQALQNKNTLTSLITRFLDKMNTLSKNNSIILTIVPSHFGIHRNEKADKAAKKALLADISNTKIPYSDLKTIIKKFILNKWHDKIQNKLHHIQDTVGEWPTGYRRSRKEDVVLFRFCIGHTHITHSHLKKEDTPICLMCKAPLTIKRILINCD